MVKKRSSTSKKPNKAAGASGNRTSSATRAKRAATKKKAATKKAPTKSSKKKVVKKTGHSGAAAGDTTPQWRARAHRTAVEFNWDYGCSKLHEIIRQQCDLGTALEIYWSGRPDFYRQYKSREEIETGRDVFDMLVDIERNVLSGFYLHQNIAYDPFDDHGHDMTNVYPELARKFQCQLPAEMYQPVGESPPRKPRRTRRNLPVGLTTIAEAAEPQGKLTPKEQAIRELNDAASGSSYQKHVVVEGDDVSEVNFSGDEKVQDSDLRRLKYLPELKSLTIGQFMTDDAFQYLKFVPNLEQFRIGGGGYKITGTGLKYLKHVPHLKKLDIGGHVAKTDDTHLAHLRYMPKLVELDLSGLRKITDAGLVHLKHLKQLKILKLSSTKIANEGLAHLAPLLQLEVLDLHWYTKVTNPGLACLAKLKNLKNLNLAQTKIGDPGLVHLEALTQLEELDLDGTKVTEKGVEKLQQSLPNCEISFEED